MSSGYISDISRQGYLVRRRLKLELPSAMSGPCQHFTPLRNLTQTFSDGISSTPSESTDWWMSLPYLQSLLRFVRFLNVSGWISVMSFCCKQSSQAGKENKNDFSIMLRSSQHGAGVHNALNLLKFSTCITASRINNILNVGHGICSNAKEQWTCLKIGFRNIRYVVMPKILILC